MKKGIETIFFYTLGWILIILGIMAVFAPIIPGFILIIFGIYLISLRSIWVKSKLDQFMEKHPSLDTTIKRVNQWWLVLFGRIINFLRGKK